MAHNVPAHIVRETTKSFLERYRENPTLLEGHLGQLLALGRVPPGLNPEDPGIKKVVDEAKKIHNS